MGLYVTPDDLATRFGAERLAQVTAHSAPVPGQVDEVAVAAAIRDAESTVTTYLQVRYRTPLASWPEALTRAVSDMAWYYLRQPNASEGEAQAYKDALRWARDIAEGRADLVDAQGQAGPAAGGIVQVAGPEKIFSRHSLRRL